MENPRTVNSPFRERGTDPPGYAHSLKSTIKFSKAQVFLYKANLANKKKRKHKATSTAVCITSRLKSLGVSQRQRLDMDS